MGFDSFIYPFNYYPKQGIYHCRKFSYTPFLSIPLNSQRYFFLFSDTIDQFYLFFDSIWMGSISELSRISGPSDVRRGPRERSRGGWCTGWWAAGGSWRYRGKADRQVLGFQRRPLSCWKMRLTELLGLCESGLRIDRAVTLG